MPSNSALVDELRWKKFSVLNDGFVCLVDVMGDDSSIVQAARVSYGEGTKKVSDDRTLIRYLLRHRHTTPFEMAEIKILVRVPMDCWRQWIRHRMANVNEYSTRYSVAIDSAQETAPEAWRTQADQNRQGSGLPLPTATGEQLTADERHLHDESRRIYEARLAAGVAREQARKDLPLATYTEAYWKVDIHIRAVGMSGKTVEGAQLALPWADALMVEYNLRDQSHHDVISQAASQGIAVFVKKGLGSGNFPAAESIRFVLSHSGVSSLIVGGLNLSHFAENWAVAAEARRSTSARG